MSALPAAWAYANTTVHVRTTPYRRAFKYKVFQLFLDIDRLDEADRMTRLLAVDRGGLFSFWRRDHGARIDAPLRPWAEAQFAAAGVSLEGGPIRLLCFPRVLNYVFNPLSVYFGYGPQGDLRGVIYEVNNTFGETHAYVSSTPERAHGGPKAFHVSPFFAVDGGYRFRLRSPDERFALSIENRKDGVRTHLATLAGERRALTDAALAKVFFAFPLMTLNVIAAIHWEAVQIWLKGARYHRKPKPPQHPVSVLSGSELSEGTQVG